MKVVIIGGGGFGKEALDILSYSHNEVIGFIDPELKGKEIQGVKVLGGDEVLVELIKKEKVAAFVAVAKPTARKKIFERVKKLGYKMINVIHPTASISKSAKIGEGNIVYGGVTINTLVSIGDGCLINSNVSIGHETKLGNFVNLNPGVNIGGKILIKDGAYIGIGADAIEEVTIGENTIVGGGAVVIKDLPDNVTAVGVPAKVIKNEGVK